METGSALQVLQIGTWLTNLSHQLFLCPKGCVGTLNDIRAVLGNDIAIKAYREGKLPFPEGAIVGRIAWSYVPSEENNKTFGRDQSFVAGAPTDSYLQFMVKDSKKYAATGGWGYSSFGKDGKPFEAASMQSCYRR